MTKSRIMLGAVLYATLIGGGVAIAQRPEQDIDAKRHANLAAAQRLCGEAWVKIDDAQKANKDQLGGHAEKAKHLLEEVNRELKEAAEFANKEHR
jgi:hypothetical protein